MAALFCVGPTLAILNSTLMSFGDYISGLIKESFMTAPYGGGYEDHLRSWTLYYWAWWIAWAPFSGSFIARISRGRTIREFIAGVLIVPALGSLTWFGIFGTSALQLEIVEKAGISAAVLQDISVGIFKMFSHYHGRLRHVDTYARAYRDLLRHLG